MHSLQTTLKNLREGEAVQLVFKRHWIVFVRIFVTAFLLITSTITLIAYRDSVFSLLPPSIFWAFMTVYWAMMLLFMYIDFINNELDFFIITNKRVIGIEQLAFLNRTISECSIQNVQEVNAQTKGLLGNLLDFGIITIHTASEQSDFRLFFVEHPLDNARHIENVIQEFKIHPSQLAHQPSAPAESATTTH